MARECVVVSTGARLHLGFYNFYNPSTGIAYGGIGVGLEEPRLTVKLCRRGGGAYPVHPDIRGDVELLLEKGLLGVDAAIEALSLLERHVGLGSTTQLRLAIALAYALLEGEKPGIYELAVRAGRGLVSGIGIEVFRAGGLVVDSGRRAKKGAIEPPRSVGDLPRAIARVMPPRDWVFLVILPKARRGLPENPRERRILSTPRPISEEERRILYTRMTELLLAVSHGDLDVFGEALRAIDAATGRYFSHAQGGRYCCREVEALVRIASDSVGRGAGQSSWGPTVYTIVAEEDAEKAARRILDRAQQLGIGIQALYASKARRNGALISFC